MSDARTRPDPLRLRRPVAVLVVAITVFCSGGGPWAQARAEAPSATAMDLVYDAADAIDEAREHFAEGRMSDGDRLLTVAERHLDSAEEIEPGLPRIRYERARLQQADHQPGIARDTLREMMAGELSTVEHVKTAALLDSVRADLDLAPIGLHWKRTTQTRKAGLAALGGGLAVSLIGVAISFGAYAQDSTDGLERTTQRVQEAGWVLSAVGGGVAVAGGVVSLAAQVRLADMQSYLPGPWRLGDEPNQRASLLRPAGVHFAVVLRPPARTAKGGAVGTR